MKAKKDIKQLERIAMRFHKTFPKRIGYFPVVGELIRLNPTLLK